MSRHTGQSLVELLVIIALSSLLLPALITGTISSRSGKAQQNQRLAATALLQETTEAVRAVRETGWNGIATNGTYHPVISGSNWALAAGDDTIDGFTRSVIIADTYRNSAGAIVDNGGIADPSTKKITIEIVWNTPVVASVSDIIYISRYLHNANTTHTTQADFNTGTATGVTITNDQGGEVILGAGGQGLWCAPNLSITALDLPRSGVANAVTAIEGSAYVGTGENASGEALAHINLSNTNPPVATILDTFDDCCKTNDVYGETNYAYLATDTNAKEVEVVDLTTDPYSESGYVNLPGNTDANSIFVAGTIGYATADNKLYNFDLASKSGSRPLLDSNGVAVSLLGNAGELYVVGNYAYVTIGAYALRELAIVDISTPSNLQVVGWADVNGEAGQEVYVNSTGTRAYLATDASTTKAEFFIINTATKTGSRPVVSSYDANGMDPRGVTVVTGNKAILVGHGAEEYQVIDITNENSPTRCGGLQVNTGINEVSSVLEVDGDAYSYIITGDASAEFKIIEGGPGGQYSSNGTIESSTIQTTSQSLFNRFNATISRPSQTDIKLQLAIHDAIAGSCNGVTFSFVGPDKTSATYFTTQDDQTISAILPTDDDNTGFENPGQCVRYKAYLDTSDQSQTPVLYDVSINYSP